jgi:hypothetical protein
MTGAGRARLRVVAYGGGVQSTALLVLAAQRRVDFGTFVFANVGDDSESPATLTHLHEVAAPYAAAHGIALHELSRARRDGTVETLYGRQTRPGSKSLPIPVRMSNGAPGTRSCTADFKIRVLGRWLRQHGAASDQPAVVAVGISRDEFHRAHNRREQPHERVVYPLLDLGLDRAACQQIIRTAGLPVPGKSACWFCPFRRPSSWAELRRDDPALFDRACHLENHLNQRRAELGRDPVWLTRFNQPLGQAIGAAQDTLPGLSDLDDPDGLDSPADDTSCVNGACWT